MSAISHMLSEINFEIPDEILDAVFIEPQKRYRRSLGQGSRDQNIIALIIKQRVIRDCSLISGKEIMVDLSRAQKEVVDQFTTVWVIPKSMTDGRSIVSVSGLAYLDPNSISNVGAMAMCGRSEMGVAARAVMDSVSSIPPIGTSRAELIGENTVQVRNTSAMTPAYSHLRCSIEYDSGLQSISPRSYPRLSELAVLAVKAYIWKHLVIKMGATRLQAGQSLSEFKDEVDSYRDANEEYKTMRREVIGKLLNQQDEEKDYRLWRLVMGGVR